MTDWLGDLESTCSSLGTWDGANYVKEEDCIECIKDLIRFVSDFDTFVSQFLGSLMSQVMGFSLHMSFNPKRSKTLALDYCNILFFASFIQLWTMVRFFNASLLSSVATMTTTRSVGAWATSASSSPTSSTWSRPTAATTTNSWTSCSGCSSTSPTRSCSCSGRSCRKTR